jgi:hypothetical protein
MFAKQLFVGKRRTRAAMAGKAWGLELGDLACAGGEQTHNSVKVARASVSRALSMSFEVYDSHICEHVPGWLVLLPVT